MSVCWVSLSMQVLLYVYYFEVLSIENKGVELSKE